MIFSSSRPPPSATTRARHRRPPDAPRDWIDRLLDAIQRAGLGAVAAVTISGLFLQHSLSGDVLISLAGAAIAVWDAWRNGAI
ncbi:hypothetical protein ACQ86G_28335 [Roseateles chitinivorans]|uniref:hypothetical protein n=1 Tax=Roseateles chitinivorans TaxID=2917965 RepID=UPI003D665C85